MYTVLRMSKKYRTGSLPRMLCLSVSELHNKYIKGILIVKENILDFKKDEQLVVINNLFHLSKEKLFTDLNISQTNDMKLLSIPDYLENYFEFFSFNDYKKEYLEAIKQKKKEVNLKRNIKKEYDGLTSEKINKIYESIELPDIPNINKADFLEYYLHFDNNLERYKILSELKSKDVSWRDFKYKKLHNMKIKNLNLKNTTFIIEHKTSNITENLFSKTKELGHD